MVAVYEYCIFIFIYCALSGHIGLFVWQLKLRLLEPVLPSNDPPSMSTEPSFKCSQCRRFKPSSEYGTRQKRDQRGEKGDRQSLCLSCNADNSERRKRKRAQSDHGHPAKRLATQHPISPNQFVEALTAYDSASEINDSWRVSVNGMTTTDKDIANHLASLAWEATGYRFR